MAKELKTGWTKIATSGSVVYGKDDGRVIQKQWLIDMVANFNLNVFTPQLWPEHDRWFHPVGKILSVKVEDTTEPDLAGEIHLFAILAPTDGLIEANRSGHYTFPSIEVGENYLGKGTFFLQGVGVTDDPASAGIDQLKFSRSESVEKTFSFPGVEFNASETLVEEKTFFERFLPSKKDINQTEEVDDAMDPKQFSKFESSMDKHFESLSTVIEGFSTVLTGLVEGQKAFAKKLESDNTDNKDEDDSGPDAAALFAQMTEQLTAIQEDNKSLRAEFERLSGEETGGSGDDGDDGTGGNDKKTVL